MVITAYRGTFHINVVYLTISGYVPVLYPGPEKDVRISLNVQISFGVTVPQSHPLFLVHPLDAGTGGPRPFPQSAPYHYPNPLISLLRDGKYFAFANSRACLSRASFASSLLKCHFCRETFLK